MIQINEGINIYGTCLLRLLIGVLVCISESSNVLKIRHTQNCTNICIRHTHSHMVHHITVPKPPHTHTTHRQVHEAQM